MNRGSHPLIVVALIVITLCSLSTSTGRALLPRNVSEAISKLSPRTPISDATASPDGETKVVVGGKANPKTVYVQRRGGMTIAWTCDATSPCPRSGTFAFTSFQHNLKPGSAIEPEQVRTRVRDALTDALAPKQFQPAEPDVASIGISVFGALEDEVTLRDLGEAFNEPDGHEWGTALRTALEHENVDESARFARGSLMVEVVDSRSQRVLWQAVAMADLVVDVSERERERRTRQAIAEVFKQFPANQRWAS